MSNTLELRKVIVRTIPGTGGGTYTEQETWEYRARDVVIELLGVSLGGWSPWTRIESTTVVVDQNGNPL